MPCSINYFWSYKLHLSEENIMHWVINISLLFLLLFIAALQSVFPQTELGTFMSLIKRDKERQLVELTEIVTGIRLFNKECGKGGEGIDDLPAILNEAVPATTQNVDAAIQKACGIAFRYTGESLLVNLYTMAYLPFTCCTRRKKSQFYIGSTGLHIFHVYPFYSQIMLSFKPFEHCVTMGPLYSTCIEPGRGRYIIFNDLLPAKYQVMVLIISNQE